MKQQNCVFFVQTNAHHSFATLTFFTSCYSFNAFTLFTLFVRVIRLTLLFVRYAHSICASLATTGYF